jgi:hypothetical protein
VIDPEYTPSDDDTAFCAACLHRLRCDGCREERCPHCDKPIETDADYLTADQYARRSREDAELMRGAEESGLIRPQGVSDGGE